MKTDDSGGSSTKKVKPLLVIRSYGEGGVNNNLLPPSSASPLLSTFPTAGAIKLLNSPVDQSAHDMAQTRRIYQILGGTIGGVVLILISIVLLFLYRRSKRTKRHSGPYGMGPLQAVLPKSKEAFTSPHYGHYGLSFISSAPPSTDSLPLPDSSRLSRQGRDSTTTS